MIRRRSRWASPPSDPARTPSATESCPWTGMSSGDPFASRFERRREGREMPASPRAVNAVSPVACGAALSSWGPMVMRRGPISVARGRPHDSTARCQRRLPQARWRGRAIGACLIASMGASTAAWGQLSGLRDAERRSLRRHVCVQPCRPRGGGRQERRQGERERDAEAEGPPGELWVSAAAQRGRVSAGALRGRACRFPKGFPRGSYLDVQVRRVACPRCGTVKREPLAFLADNPLN
jgi:hypothetical protein